MRRLAWENSKTSQTVVFQQSGKLQHFLTVANVVKTRNNGREVRELFAINLFSKEKALSFAKDWMENHEDEPVLETDLVFSPNQDIAVKSSLFKRLKSFFKPR